MLTFAEATVREQQPADKLAREFQRPEELRVPSLQQTFRLLSTFRAVIGGLKTVVCFLLKTGSVFPLFFPNA